MRPLTVREQPISARQVSEQQDMQITIFGEETPTSEVPHLNCTRTKNCPAPADAHHEDCPVEQDLRATFGF